MANPLSAGSSIYSAQGTQGRDQREGNPIQEERNPITVATTNLLLNADEGRRSNPKPLNRQVRQVPNDSTSTSSTSMKTANVLNLSTDILDLVFRRCPAADLLNLRLVHSKIYGVITGSPTVYKHMLREIAFEKMFRRLEEKQERGDQYCAISQIVEDLAEKYPAQAFKVNQLQKDPLDKARAFIKIAKVLADPKKVDELLVQASDSINQIQYQVDDQVDDNEEKKKALDDIKNDCLRQIVEIQLLKDVEKACLTASMIHNDNDQMNDFFKIVQDLEKALSKAKVELNDVWKKALVKIFKIYIGGSDKGSNYLKVIVFLEIAKAKMLTNPMQADNLVEQALATTALIQNDIWKVVTIVEIVKALSITDIKKAQITIQSALILADKEGCSEPLIKGLLEIVKIQLKNYPQQLQEALILCTEARTFTLCMTDINLKNSNLSRIAQLLALIDLDEALSTVNLINDKRWEAVTLLKIRKQILLTKSGRANTIFKLARRKALLIPADTSDGWEGSKHKDFSDLSDQVYILLKVVKAQAFIDLKKALKLAKFVSKKVDPQNAHQNFIYAYLAIVKVISKSTNSEQINEMFKQMLFRAGLIKDKVKQAKLLLKIGNERVATDQKHANEIFDQVFSLVKLFLEKEESEDVTIVFEDEDAVEDAKNLPEEIEDEDDRDYDRLELVKVQASTSVERAVRLANLYQADAKKYAYEEIIRALSKLNATYEQFYQVLLAISETSSEYHYGQFILALSNMQK